MQVTSNGNATSIGQAIELTSTGRSQFKHGTSYTLSFYARTASGTNSIEANVYYRNTKFSSANQTNWSGSAGNNHNWTMGTMSTTWQRFEKTFTSPGNPNANNKVLAIELNNSASYYVTGIQFEEGTIATPFEFKNYAEELANCMRYYEGVYMTHGTAAMPSYSSYGGSTNFEYQFKVEKRSQPTFALEGDASWVGATPNAFLSKSNCMFQHNSGTLFRLSDGSQDLCASFDAEV